MDNDQNQNLQKHEGTTQQSTQPYSENPQNNALPASNYEQSQFQPSNPLNNSKPNPIKGILWILSPFILLIVIAVLQIIVHFVLSTTVPSPSLTDTGSSTLNSSTGSTVSSTIVWIIDIISILAGMLAIILFPVGLIKGIKSLTKK